MSIRVLLVTDALDRYGAAKQLALLAAGLPRDDFDVRVCALARGGPLQAKLQRNAVAVTVLGRRSKPDVATFWRLRREVKKAAADVVHTFSGAANGCGRWAAVRAGAPHVVGSARNINRGASRSRFAIDRFLARRSDRVVANSGAVMGYFAAGGLPEEKLTVIPNGVEIGAPPANTREEMLQSLGLPPESRLVGAVGRLLTQKRLKDVIWAVELLKRARDDTHLLIIGDGPHRWRLERYHRQIEIDDRVHFLGERDDLPSLLPHFDCLLQGSRYEGPSNAVMEAMAAGVPVVAADTAANREFITPGETGFLAPVGDRAAMAQGALLLLEDPALSRRIAAAARQRMQDRFSARQMVERHADLYREIVGR